MQKQRFEILDGLRGVAAVCVVVFHAHNYLGFNHLMPRGYLAVDFFFVLSGFVIAYSFEHRLVTKKLTVAEFIRTRFLRLAPMNVLGLTVGASCGALLVRWLPSQFDVSGQQWTFFVMAFATTALFLPYFASGSAVMMPANPPSWSLFFEMVANIGYAISVPFLRTSALVATCAVAMAGLVLYGVTWGSIEYCPTATTALLAGALRVSFSFPAGVLVYRYWNGGNKAPRVAAWAICALLVAIFLAPGGGPKHRYILDLAVIALILPPLVWIGASARETGKLWRLSGELSYPLYAIHYIPLVAACVVISGATESLALRAAGLAAVVAALCGAALMASRAERAMRQALEPKGAPLVKRLVEFGAHNRAHPTTPLARLFRANPPKPLVPCQICGAPATPGGVMGNVCQSCGAW